MCIESLLNENIEPVGFWYNPNIHPYMEYKARKETLINYAREIGMELIMRDDYGLRKFIKGISGDFNERCGFCYSLRAASTLLISPYQNHDLLCRIMKESAEKNGVEFLYRDFRPYFREGQKRAREKGFYMQKYCGCIFSEEERYLKKNKNQ